MECRKCKKEIPDDAIYCCYCGIKQEKEKKHAKRPNGTGTIYKVPGLKSKPWRAEKGKTLLGYFETKRAAQEAIDRLSGRSVDERYNMTFEEVFECWKKEHYKEVSAAQETYNTAFKIFQPLHKTKFRDLRTSDYQKVLDPHMGKAYSTVSKYKQLISQMTRWAMREEIVTTDYSQFIKLPKQKKVEKVVFTQEEINKFFNDDSETAKVVCMLLTTGMRTGEIFKVKLEDYHGEYIVAGSKTETGRNRTIPILPEGRKYFEYFVKQATGPLLLSGYTGNKNVRNFQIRDYNKLVDRLGISKDKTPYTTRHTFTTLAVKAGVRPEVLKEVLGHEQYSTTVEKYTHLDTRTLVDEISSITTKLPQI